MTSSRTLKILLAAFAIAIAVVVASSLFVFGKSDDKLRGALIEPPRDVSAQRLTDVFGLETGFEAPPKGINLTFFGFTHCPDICPTTLSDVRSAIGALGAKQDRVKVTMVTIDPARDNAQVLRDYVGRFFDPTVGYSLRTDDQTRLQQVTKAFGAAYEIKPPTAADGEPDVSHTAWLYAVDDAGRIKTQWAFGTPWKDITHDLKILLS